MQISKLGSLVENETDKIIFSHMAEDGDAKLNKRIGDMICTCIGSFRLHTEQKNQIRSTLNGFNADSFGGVGAALLIIPYFEIKFKHMEKIAEASNGFVIHLMNYLIKEIDKAEFIQKIWVLQEAVGISDKFYDGLVDYFGFRKSEIIVPVMSRF